jgi:hypothetical protein
MAQEQQIPGEAERKAFVEKLGQFRGTLQPKEQAMLDAMAMAAFKGEESDVQGYQWFYGGYYAAPVWYQTGYATQWYASPWGYAYRTVPTGVWYP